jgi:uncharacterized membrane protein YbhN (UPF0104 family)
MKQRLLAALGPILGLGLFALAIGILHHELAEYHYRDVLEHLRAIPGTRLALALALTALGYFSLTGYDALAMRWIGSPIRYPRIALASFIAYVFSHNVGLSFFGGSAVRYRMFTSCAPSPTNGCAARAPARSASRSASSSPTICDAARSASCSAASRSSPLRISGRGARARNSRST